MYWSFFCTDKGLREYQEDCVFINGEIVQEDHLCGEKIIKGNKALFAVSDGMGGLSFGDMASRFVCGLLKEMDIPFTIEGVLKGIQSIQREFMRTALYNSGTTLAGVYMNKDRSIIFNVGDSRVYKITKEKAVYISHDHSYVQSLVDRGIISYQQSFFHPAKNIIEFGIGDVFQEEWLKGKKPYILEDKLKEDEYYLITTDGVHDVLTDREIHYLLCPEPKRGILNLIKELEKKKSDNYSLILVRWE
jgi:serine/threonine protein phosphatase PrpC